MNRLYKYISFVTVLMCMSSLWGASSLPIRLRGVMIGEGSMIFSINCMENGASGWFEIGRYCCGYKLVEFDETTMTLRLEYENESYYLNLSDRSELSGETNVGNTIGDIYDARGYSQRSTGRTAIAETDSRTGRTEQTFSHTNDLKSVTSPRIAEGNSWYTNSASSSTLSGENEQADPDESSLVRRRKVPQVQKVPRPSQFIIVENYLNP